MNVATFLLQAQTEYSNGNYEACAEILKQIDITSPCATEAKSFMSAH